MTYKSDSKLYVLTNDEVVNELGINLMELDFIENTSDVDRYLTRISRIVHRHIQNLGPREPGTKFQLRRNVINWLLFINENGEQADIKELMFEHVMYDIEGDVAALMTQTQANGVLLDKATKAALQFSPLFEDTLDNSILGRKRYYITIPSDKFEVGY